MFICIGSTHSDIEMSMWSGANEYVHRVQNRTSSMFAIQNVQSDQLNRLAHWQHIAVVKLSIKYLYDINYWHEYAQFAFSLTWMSTSVWAHSHPVHSNSLHTLIKWMVISLERFLRHMINRKLFNYIVWTTATMCMCERRIACSRIILWTTFFLLTMLHECTFVRALFLHSKFLLLVKRKAIIWITVH